MNPVLLKDNVPAEFQTYCARTVVKINTDLVIVWLLLMK